MKKILIACFVCLLFSLTSCEKEYYWAEASLDCHIDAYTNNRGYFEQTYFYYPEDIYIYQHGYYNRIRGIDLTDCWIEISGINSRPSETDFVENLTIWVAGVGNFTFPYTPSFGRNNTIVVDYNTSGNFVSYITFMVRVMDYLYRNGSIEITVSGYLRSYYTPYHVEVSLYNSLRVKVEDY